MRVSNVNRLVHGIGSGLNVWRRFLRCCRHSIVMSWNSATQAGTRTTCSPYSNSIAWRSAFTIWMGPAQGSSGLDRLCTCAFTARRNTAGAIGIGRWMKWAEWLPVCVRTDVPIYAYFNNDIGGHAPRDAALIADAARRPCHTQPLAHDRRSPRPGSSFPSGGRRIGQHRKGKGPAASL